MAQDQFAEHARTAFELDGDVTVEQIAQVYAEALLRATERAGQTEEVLEQFESLLVDVFDRWPKLEEILASAMVSFEEKAQIIERTIGSQAHPLFRNFLLVVARRGRMDCLRAIYRECLEKFDQLRGRVPVEVTSATALSDELLQRVGQAVKDLVGGEPIITAKVDPKLIGGIVVRVGDKIYDASVATQLVQLREKIVRRSSHEIQSRRDRFRHPAGN